MFITELFTAIKIANGRVGYDKYSIELNMQGEHPISFVNEEGGVISSFPHIRDAMQYLDTHSKQYDLHKNTS